MAVLPRYVVLESIYNHMYLRHINEDHIKLNLQLHGYLRFSGAEVISPYAKHEVEMSKNVKGLVHIRCCYNNKYWVSDGSWIVAQADEPSEDQSESSCTLFEPIFIGENTIRLRHVKLGRYASLKNFPQTEPCTDVKPSTFWESLVVGLLRLSQSYQSLLCTGSSTIDEDKLDVFKVIDWDSLLILPKHVAFKGDNGNYLSARWIEGHQYLQFSSTDVADSTVGNQVFITRDGSIRIKSDHFNKFWRRSPNWIWADSTDNSTNNPDTLFWPTRVDNNIVALRNMGNKNFCKRLTTEGKTSCLNAATSIITKEARLVVEELVLSRDIHNVDFRLMDARIYNQTPLTMAQGIALNRTHQPNTVNLKLSYSNSKAQTWNSSISLKLDVKTNFKTRIPLIAQGQVEISAEFTGASQWGNTVESTEIVEASYQVTVPPMTKVNVRLLATKASCDVPFSYSQIDTLLNGNRVTYTMDDGIYTGINSYNFKYESEEQKLSREEQKLSLQEVRRISIQEAHKETTQKGYFCKIL